MLSCASLMDGAVYAYKSMPLSMPIIRGVHVPSTTDGRMSLVTLCMLRYQGLLKLVSPSRRYTGIGGQPASKRLETFVKLFQKMYTTVEKGAPNSTSYRVFFKNDLGVPISPMHDIPLYADEKNKIMNMVVEIPRWTNAKMEICLKETLNPIKQDVKNGKLRFVANCFPHHGYIWNYGALPQTWENPEVLDEATGCKGDNDPIDVLEIGYRIAKRGEVLKVKVLGTVALIDEGETDWKIIVIDINDPLANQINDINDVEKHCPGLLKATIEWFKIYKIPDGKPENQFAFNGEAKPREFAMHIIDEVHQHWQNLIKQETSTGIACSNVTVEGSSFKILPEAAKEVLGKESEPVEPQSVEPIVDKWHYIHLK